MRICYLSYSIRHSFDLFLLAVCLFPFFLLCQPSNKKSQKFQRPVEYRTSRATRASAKTRILVLPQYDTECHLTVRVNPRRLLLHLRAAAMRMAGRRWEQQRREVNMVPREIPKRGINGRSKARREKERRKDKREGSERKRGEGREGRRRRSIAPCFYWVSRFVMTKRETLYRGISKLNGIPRYFPGLVITTDLFRFDSSPKSNDFRSVVSRTFYVSASSWPNETRDSTSTRAQKLNRRSGLPFPNGCRGFLAFSDRWKESPVARDAA